MILTTNNLTCLGNNIIFPKLKFTYTMFKYFLKRNKILKYFILFFLYILLFYIAEYFDTWSKIKQYIFSK